MQHVWDVLGAWTVDPLIAAVLIALGCGYLLAANRTSRMHPHHPWPIGNSATFIGGLAIVWIALLGPFGTLDDVFFWAHMCQHLLLTMLAAPLLVLGTPVLLVLRSANRDQRRRWILPVLRSSAVRWLTDPVVTWLLFAVVLMGTHFSPFYDWALRNQWAHYSIEHPLFLGVAVLYYYPLLGSSPTPHALRPAGRLISLGLMMVPEAFTGFFIYASPYVMYPFYRTVHRPYGPSPLIDQQLGGALMWSAGMLLDTAWLVVAAREWLRADRRRTRRVDAEIARETVAEAAPARIRFL